ncbi:MAG: transglycosylase family protein [Actinomycetota bacterium]|nr:transglycosylase family protein [Actinomycetota bacterium]
MPLLRTHKPRHAKPSKAAPTLMAVSTVGGMSATLGALAAPASAASEDDFARLRQCESGGNYRTNTGNGYYGAYQFDTRTWHGLGYNGYPHQASPATQDQAAHELQADRGWQPWPACARKLGLGRDDARASRSGRRTVLVGRPEFTQPLTKQLVHQQRTDVRAWQARMKQRGWDIKADGRFGPRSAKVAARFAAEKGIHVNAGTVDHAMWNAAWAMPVT